MIIPLVSAGWAQGRLSKRGSLQSMEETSNGSLSEDESRDFFFLLLNLTSQGFCPGKARGRGQGSALCFHRASEQRIICTRVKKKSKDSFVTPENDRKCFFQRASMRGSGTQHAPSFLHSPCRLGTETQAPPRHPAGAAPGGPPVTFRGHRNVLIFLYFNNRRKM